MNISPLVLLPLGELLLITSVVSLLMVVRAMMRGKRERAAALALIKQVKKNQEQRSEGVRNLVEKLQGSDDTQADDLIDKIRIGELSFFQSLVDGFVKRDASALATIRKSFEAATEPYRQMEPASQASAEEDDENASVSAAELASLLEEKERLAEELKITMDTMGRMLNEYATMYWGGSDEELDTEKIADMYREDNPENDPEVTFSDDMSLTLGETDQTAALDGDKMKVPVPDQEWIDEASEISDDHEERSSTVTGEVVNTDEDDLDETRIMEAADFMDELVSLDVESGGKG